MTAKNTRTGTSLLSILISLALLGQLLSATEIVRGQSSGNPYLDRPPLPGGGGSGGSGSGLGGGGFGGILGGGSQYLHSAAEELPAPATTLTSNLTREQNYCLGCLFSHPAETIFPDLKNHFARNAVQMLAETTSHGEIIVRGFAVNTNQANEFRPEQSITRAEFLKMSLLSSCIEIKKWDQRNPPTRQFQDLSADSELWYKNTVYTASELGIVDGYDDGNFHGDKPITRAEAAKILVNLQKPEAIQIINGTEYFQDVSRDEWFYNYIYQGRELGLVYGSKNSAGKNVFRPKSNLSRGETAVMLARMLKQKEFVSFDDPDAHNYVYLRSEQVLDANKDQSSSQDSDNQELQSNLLGAMLTVPWFSSIIPGLGAVFTLWLLRSRGTKRRKRNRHHRIDE